MQERARELDKKQQGQTATSL